MPSRATRGFILPLSIMLVLLLTISGTSFMHHDFLERRMAMNDVDNHGAFYLANAGIERARETLKISEPAFTWTPLLSVGVPADNQFSCAGQLMCPDLGLGCAKPPFPDPAQAPEIPFSGTFTNTEYRARAFNNASEGTMIDFDQQLTIRACGIDRGEIKLLEATVQAISGLDLINCEGDSETTPCPNVVSGEGTCTPDTESPTCTSVDNRDPEAHPTLPSLKAPLADPPLDPVINFYRFDVFPANFTDYSPGPALTVATCASGIDCSKPQQISIDIQDNTFYFIDIPDSKVKVINTGPHSRVVVYALGGATGGVIWETAPNDVQTDMMLIGQGQLDLKGGILHAPLPLPAVVAEGNVGSGSASVNVFGTIFATNTPIPTGVINVNPVNVHGVLIGNTVEVQGSSDYSDDNNLAYYAFMPGFDYPEELKSTIMVPGGNTWREIQ